VAKVHHLANAPIREALLDIRVDLPAEFSAAVFKQLQGDVGKAYPKMIEGTRLQTNLQLGGTGKISAESVEMGLHSVIFMSEDEKTIAQFRTDGFTLNKLRPYTEWDTIFPEAMRLWTVFLSAARPASVSRTALRYINEFDLPGGLSSLPRFLRSLPPTPPAAPGRPRGFLTRVFGDDEKSRLGSVVTYSVGETSMSQTHVVLDIDVHCTAIPGVNRDDLSPAFGRLRDIKNQIFFQSLSDEAILLFDQP
jgi:uncharacterized protein (TIGR04255 family)